MKCIICKKEFESDVKDKNIVASFCPECEEIQNELTNGKGEE